MLDIILDSRLLRNGDVRILHGRTVPCLAIRVAPPAASFYAGVSENWMQGKHSGTWESYTPCLLRDQPMEGSVARPL